MDFSQLALLLSVAAIFGVIAKLLKQPLLIGFLFAGFLLQTFGIVQTGPGLESLGKIGVALLLFLVGLEMNVSELPSIGKAALLTGLGQIIFTSVIGYFLSVVLGFGMVASLYIAIGLTFSSTIIIVKLLGEKNALESLYGKISVGFLLVQDLVAVILLMFLASIGTGEASMQSYALIAVKGVSLLVVLYVLSKKVLPQFFSVILDSSTELIFIVSIGWALGVAAFVGGPLGFSIEIGGFLAGITLSNLPEHLQVSSRTRPLRDFFLTIFFLVLGTNLVVGHISSLLLPAIVFSAFVLIGNPLIVMVIMGLLGYRKKTSFLASVTVAQISEFSLILAAMGERLGHLTSSEVSMIVLVGIITMTASTYLIMGADKIFKKISPLLDIFERDEIIEVALEFNDRFKDHIVLVGSDRTGTTIRKYLKQIRKKYLVVDYNPSVVKKLNKNRIPVIYGDITDDDVFESARVGDSAMLISTSSDYHDNLTLLERMRKLKKRPIIILKAVSIYDALVYYEKGATYVIVPGVLAGEHVRHILKSYGVSVRIKKLGKGHLRRLSYM